MTIKHILIIILAFFAKNDSYCQYKYTDSLIEVIKTTKADSTKIYTLYDLSYAYQSYKPDSALIVAVQLYDFAISKNNTNGISLALDGMAGAFLRMGDNTSALKYYLERLKIEEKNKDLYNMATLYMNLANVFNRNKDNVKAAKYILMADSIINVNNFQELKVYSFLNTGNIFEKLNRLPEALDYTLNSYQLALLSNDSLMMGSALNNLGNIYYKMNQFSDAIKSYKRSRLFVTTEKDNQTLTEGYIGLAKAYASLGKSDSVLFFAKKSYSISYQYGLLDNALIASTFLTNFYKDRSLFDSAFLYQTNMLQLTDSVRNNEKIKQMESMSIQEQIREQQLLFKLKKEKEEYQQRLQLLAIGIAIPLFFLFSIIISRKKVHIRVVRFFGILSLLLFFEYITLFLHPFVSALTHHNAFLEIIIFVFIGALIVPAHHRLEHWFTKHLAKNYEAHKRFKSMNDLNQ